MASDCRAPRLLVEPRAPFRRGYSGADAGSPSCGGPPTSGPLSFPEGASPPAPAPPDGENPAGPSVAGVGSDPREACPRNPGHGPAWEAREPRYCAAAPLHSCLRRSASGFFFPERLTVPRLRGNREDVTELVSASARTGPLAPSSTFFPLAGPLRCQSGAGGSVCLDANLGPSPSVNGALHRAGSAARTRPLRGRGLSARRRQAPGVFESGCV